MISYRADWVRQPEYKPTKSEQKAKSSQEPKPRLRTSAALLTVLTDVAEQGAPCPTNVELGAMVGRATEHSIASALHRLKDNGLIKVRKLNRWKRVITVVSTGKSTGESRPLTREQLPA